GCVRRAGRVGRVGPGREGGRRGCVRVVVVVVGGGGTSRFPQTPSTGPLRGRALRASPRPLPLVRSADGRFAPPPDPLPLVRSADGRFAPPPDPLHSSASRTASRLPPTPPPGPPRGRALRARRLYPRPLLSCEALVRA